MHPLLDAARNSYIGLTLFRLRRRRLPARTFRCCKPRIRQYSNWAKSWPPSQTRCPDVSFTPMSQYGSHVDGVRPVPRTNHTTEDQGNRSTSRITKSQTSAASGRLGAAQGRLALAHLTADCHPSMPLRVWMSVRHIAVIAPVWSLP
jgi:hypothetical protein